jgi:hypothetical protein
MHIRRECQNNSICDRQIPHPKSGGVHHAENADSFLLCKELDEEHSLLDDRGDLMVVLARTLVDLRVHNSHTWMENAQRPECCVASVEVRASVCSIRLT